MSRIRDLLRSLRRPEPPAKSYRDPAPRDLEHDLRDLEAEMMAMKLRIRVLERQLAERGIKPAQTPMGYELATAAEVIDAIAHGREPRRNTMELRRVAEALRGLAEWAPELLDHCATMHSGQGEEV